MVWIDSPDSLFDPLIKPQKHEVGFIRRLIEWIVTCHPRAVFVMLQSQYWHVLRMILRPGKPPQTTQTGY